MNGMCWTVKMKTKVEVLLPHQVNCGNPSQRNFQYVVLCQLHPTVAEDIKLLLTFKLLLWRWMECVERGGGNRYKFLTYCWYIVATANKQHTATWPLLECR